MKLNFFSLWALAGSASAYLATTTHYYDGQEGACGCGTSSGLDTWQLGIATDVYTAAGSQALFDTDDSSWCGGGCGKCYNLTSTGESPCSTCGTGGVTGDSIIVMVTNLCPYNGNEQWCPPVDSTNDYGYSYHFDIMAESEVFGNNVVVNFEPVACPGQATTDWETCICYGETDDDTTPAGMTTAAGSSGTVATSAVSSISSTSTVVPASSTTAAESSTSTTLVEVASSSSSTQAPSTIVEPSSATSAVVEPSSTSTPVIVEPSSTTSPVVAPSSTTSPASPEGAVTTTTTSVILSTVVSETITIWATSSPTSSGAVSSTSSSSGAVQSLYGQCGGINWTGATACATGSTCKVQNPYYYQCVSSSD